MLKSHKCIGLGHIQSSQFTCDVTADASRAAATKPVTDVNAGTSVGTPAPLTAFDAVAALEELAARNSWANEAPEVILRPVRAASFLVLPKEMREQLYELKGASLKPAVVFKEGAARARPIPYLAVCHK